MCFILKKAIKKTDSFLNRFYPAEKEGFCNLSQALYLLTSRFNFKTSAPKSAPLNLAQFSTYIDSNKFKPFHSHFQT